jgi:hypothetical protein
MKAKCIHQLPTGERLTTRELCDKFDIPMQWTCGRNTGEILGYHSRRKRLKFALDGVTATAKQWAFTLGVSHTHFKKCVYGSEKFGATRQQAMIASVRFITKQNEGKKSSIATETEKLLKQHKSILTN